MNIFFFFMEKLKELKMFDFIKLNFKFNFSTANKNVFLEKSGEFCNFSTNGKSFLKLFRIKIMKLFSKFLKSWFKR